MQTKGKFILKIFLLSSKVMKKRTFLLICYRQVFLTSFLLSLKSNYFIS